MPESLGSSLVRPEALRLAPVYHGSVAAIELAELGLRPSEVLDFSVSTNPLGPAPSVLHAVRETDWSRYPGDDEPPLRRALAERSGVGPEQVVLGNGSAELMWLIALAALRPGDSVGSWRPRSANTPARPRLSARRSSRSAGPADSPSVRALFVCNPNNPTGDYRAQAEIERLLEV